MAKKLTARQRAAHKRASYIRAEYYKNVDAIRYLEKIGAQIPKEIKTPNRITKKSLTAIRRIYKETRSTIIKYEDAYVNTQTGDAIPLKRLPTKEEMVKYQRHPNETPDDVYIDFDMQSIDELKDKIDMLQPLRDSTKTDKNFNKNVLPKLEKTKRDFKNAIDDAIKQYGVSIVADALAKNEYMKRVGNMEDKYTYEIVEEVSDSDDGLITLMYTSAEAALSAL